MEKMLVASEETKTSLCKLLKLIDWFLFWSRIQLWDASTKEKLYSY